MAAEDHTTLEVAGQEVRLSSPSKVYFPVPGWTKLDVAQYYATCAEATVRGLYDRPTVLKQRGEPRRVAPSRAKRSS